MKADLFKIYKKFYQRSWRNPSNAIAVEITDAVFRLIRNVPSPSEMIAEIERIALLEHNSEARVQFSAELLAAVKKGDYEINIPPQIAHELRNENVLGHVYVLTSPSKPGQCKLGGTTMRINDRIEAYKNKYGYSVKLFFYQSVQRPFELEKLVAKNLASKRVSGSTSGDSNEWYFCDPADMKTVILKSEHSRY